ncbi:glycosyltransferase [Candidatus Gottesmanbacteria bacterium]|nr:glycosyltransferase [Candidatus Gottesmanbacteria bacterium]
MKKMVSIVVPTFNCQNIIEDCLKSVKKQTCKNIELIIVDSFSTDKTVQIGRKYGKVYSYGRDPAQKNVFAVPYQRNYGVSKAKGEYVYIIDSDMRLTSNVVESCVDLIEKRGADAVIVPEVSYGEGFWAKCRALEKACYNRSPRSLSDAARFVKKSVWEKLGGLDATLGGGDDWDFQSRLNDSGYKTMKTKVAVMHYEGKLSLGKQIYKKFRYGKNVLDYFKKHKDRKILLSKQYSLIRPDFITNIDLLIKDPIHAIGMIFMKIVEYSAAFGGLIYSQLFKEEVKIKNK